MSPGNRSFKFSWFTVGQAISQILVELLAFTFGSRLWSSTDKRDCYVSL